MEKKRERNIIRKALDDVCIGSLDHSTQYVTSILSMYKNSLKWIILIKHFDVFTFGK